MSASDSIRVEVLSRVSAGVLTLKQAAELLGLSYRHAKRLSQRYQRDGSAGLVHGHTGHRSNRAKPNQIRELALEIVRKKGVNGLGPTLAASELAEHGFTVSQETLRRWMLEAGLWVGSRKREPKAAPQPAEFGELLMLRGQLCSWAEERRIVNWFVELRDRATDTIALRVTREPIWALAGLLRSWLERYGIPRTVEIDWDRLGMRQSPAGPWKTGISCVTQFGRMCTSVDIAVVPVRSPGRGSGLESHWSQLVVHFRERGIRNDTAANAYLDSEYVPGYNRRFARRPDRMQDAHRPCGPAFDFDSVFRIEEERPISDDWTVEYRGRLYEVQRESRYPPARDKVIVREWQDRRLEIDYRGRAVRWREIPTTPERRGHFYRVKAGTFLSSGDARS